MCILYWYYCLDTQPDRTHRHLALHYQYSVASCGVATETNIDPVQPPLFGPLVTNFGADAAS